MAGENLKEELRSLQIERTAAASVRPRPGGRTALVVGAVVLVLAAGAVLTYRALVATSLAVRVVTARVAAEGKPAVGALLSGSGYLITAEKYIAIGVRVPGRIERYFVDEGDRVKAGQLLVKLDGRDYRAQTGRAEAALNVAEANRRLAEAQCERTRRLFEQGIASKDELDQAQSRRDVAAASVAQATNDRAQARVNLEDTELRSPVTGVVLAKLKTVGEIAVPGGFSGSGDLLRVADLSELRAEVDVSEADLSNVHLDQGVEVVPDAYPDLRYRARVVKLYPQVNRQKGTLKVEVKIEEPDDHLIPDMSVRITFLAAPPAASVEGGDKRPLVVVSRGAVRHAGGDTYVWVVSAQRLRRQVIKTGAELGEDVPVVEGLGGGEALVVGPETDLGEGKRVVVEK